MTAVAATTSYIKVAAITGGIIGALAGMFYNCEKLDICTEREALVRQEGLVSTVAERTYKCIEEQLSFMMDVSTGAAVGAFCFATAPLSYPAYVLFRKRQAAAKKR